MYAGSRYFPPCANAPVLAAEFLDGLFQDLLHGIWDILTLPAAEIRAVILNGQLVARHHATLSPIRYGKAVHELGNGLRCFARALDDFDRTSAFSPQATTKGAAMIVPASPALGTTCA
jgi:hypothetical protein